MGREAARRRQRVLERREREAVGKAPEDAATAKGRKPRLKRLQADRSANAVMEQIAREPMEQWALGNLPDAVQAGLVGTNRGISDEVIAIACEYLRGIFQQLWGSDKELNATLAEIAAESSAGRVGENARAMVKAVCLVQIEAAYNQVKREGLIEQWWVVDNPDRGVIGVFAERVTKETSAGGKGFPVIQRTLSTMMDVEIRVRGAIGLRPVLTARVRELMWSGNGRAGGGNV